MFVNALLSRKMSLYRDSEYLQTIYDNLSRSQDNDFPIVGTVGDYEIIIERNVFNPVLFPGGDCFANMLPVTEGCRFLDFGCGTGIVSLITLLRVLPWISATTPLRTRKQTHEAVSGRGYFHIYYFSFSETKKHREI